MNRFIAILVAASCAHAASGGVIVSSPVAGWADSSWIEGEQFQWGATTRNIDFSNGDWEIGIGNDPAMSQDSAHLDWGGAGTTHSYVLDYDPLRQVRAIWMVDGHQTLLPEPAGLFTDLYIQLKGRPSSTDARIVMSDTTITVDGQMQSIDSFAAGHGEVADLRHIHIGGFPEPLFEIDFILEGKLSIDWSGAVPPSRDETGFHIKLTQIPEPASIFMILLISVSGIFIRRRFR